MTLIVSVISADGIVIAGDSLSSLNRQINMNQSSKVKCPQSQSEHTIQANFQGNMVQATYSHTEKVFSFFQKFGIGVFGAGLIGGHSVNFLIHSFEHFLKKKRESIDGVTSLAEEIGINLHNLLKKQLEIEKNRWMIFQKTIFFSAFRSLGTTNFSLK